MKFLKVLLFILISIKSFSQDVKIDKITLSYDRSSIYNGPMKEVQIALGEDIFNKMSVYIYIDGKFKENFEISKEIFSEICKQILAIKPQDVFFDDTGLFAMDASSTSLTFGYFTRSVSYNIYALDKNDENSSRKDLLKIVQKMLEIAEIKIKEIN